MARPTIKEVESGAAPQRTDYLIVSFFSLKRKSLTIQSHLHRDANELSDCDDLDAVKRLLILITMMVP